MSKIGSNETITTKIDENAQSFNSFKIDVSAIDRILKGKDDDSGDSEDSESFVPP